MPDAAYSVQKSTRAAGPVFICLAVLSVGGAYYARSAGQDKVASGTVETIAPMISPVSSSGSPARLSAMASAPNLPVPDLPAGPEQVGSLPGVDTYVASFRASAALQAPAGAGVAHRTSPDVLPERPAVLLSPPVLPSPGQVAGAYAEDLPVLTQPVYFTVPPVRTSAPDLLQSAFDGWTALDDPGKTPRVVVNIPENVSPDRYQRAVARIDASAFSADVIGTTPFNITTTHVRYYHAADRGAAEQLAGLFEAEARDFTSYLPSPDRGLLELWVSGEGAPAVASAPRRTSEPDAVARSASATYAPRSVGLFERISNAFGSQAERGGAAAGGYPDRSQSASATTSGAGAGTAAAGSGSASSGSVGGGNSVGGGETGSSSDSSGSDGGGGSSAGESKGGKKGGGKGGDKGGGKGGKKG
ncbi:hypothetical protein [Roseobacter sp.]|uniref:hypothetical protein n=1 Tax=Roseobacter sp. TaxID=1907202 RepID=UPI0025E36FFC|nr:hypothetical protein [Roseobacter sp.]